MAIGSVDVFAAIEPVANRTFYGAKPKVEELQYPKIFKVSSTDSPTKSSVEFGGPGLFAYKAENAPMEQKRINQGPIKTWTAATYAAAMVVSREMVDDVRYGELKEMFRSVGRGGEVTPEYLCRDFLERSFDTAYPATADGKPVFSSTHLLPDGSTASNVLATPSALDETSIEDIMTQMRTAVGPDGLRTPQIAKQIIVPSALWAWAKKLSETPNQVGSNNNDVSVIKGFNVVVFDYLTNQTRWFVQTKAENGLFWDWRQKLTLDKDQVVNTLQNIYVAWFRARWGVGDWRSIYGVNAA